MSCITSILSVSSEPLEGYWKFSPFHRHVGEYLKFMGYYLTLYIVRISTFLEDILNSMEDTRHFSQPLTNCITILIKYLT